MATREPYPPNDQSQSTTGAMVDQVQEKAGQALDQVQQRTTAGVAGQKDVAIDGLMTTAHALRQTSQQLREQEHDTIAGYTEKTAQQMERVSGYLRERDVQQIINETEAFAGRSPGLFLGGTLALGVLGARFLKSSRQKGGSTASRNSSTKAAAQPRAAGGSAYETEANPRDRPQR